MRKNLLLLSVIGLSCLGCSNSSRPEFSQISSYSCDCKEESSAQETVKLRCNVSILGEEGVVSHIIDVKKGENITGKIDTRDSKTGVYDDHPTAFYKIESEGKLVNASLLYCYDGETSSLSVVNALYSEFLKDDYLFGEYTNQKGEKLYVYDFKMEGTCGEYSFDTKEMYLPVPFEFHVKNIAIKKNDKKLDVEDNIGSNLYFLSGRVENNKIVADVTTISIIPYFLTYYFDENDIEYNLNDLVYTRYNERAVSFS